MQKNHISNSNTNPNQNKNNKKKNILTRNEDENIDTQRFKMRRFKEYNMLKS